MDCRTYKEMLDSYLCDELAVETNHEMQRHAEHCPGCRNEMGARRELRRVLKITCGKEQISPEARARICEQLRSACEGGQGHSSWRRFVGWSSLPGFPAWAVPALGVLALGILSTLWFVWPAGKGRAQVSSLLLDEAAGDHGYCAAKFAQAVAPTELPGSIKRMDAAFAGLEPIVLAASAGVVLHSAHVCEFGQRRFAHLVYTRDGRLVSLLLTARDGRAVDLQRVPKDVKLSLGAQRAVREPYALSAYQTPRHVVLVVAAPPDEEMAEQGLALPVTDYLRRAEREPAVSWLQLDHWILGLPASQ